MEGERQKADDNLKFRHERIQASIPVFRSAPGFTLIEIMIVVGIMGLILASGIPSILRIGRKEGMRKATSDVVEVCSNARAQAILRGTEMDVVFYPLDRRLEVAAGVGESSGSQSGGDDAVENPSKAHGAGLSAQLADDITIEMLDINLLEYRESEFARVRFFPNGTSDELTLILHSANDEWRKISLETTTGLSSVSTSVQ